MMMFASNLLCIFVGNGIVVLISILFVSCKDISGFNRTSFVRCNLYSRDHCPMESFAGDGEATPKQFPHMALIGHRDNDDPNINWKCTGTLINGFHILTSAKCMDQNFIGPRNILTSCVMLGELNFKSTDDYTRPHVFNISKIIIHPNYRKGSDTIALIRLGLWADYNEYIRPACLYYSPLISESKAIVTGWRKVNKTQKYADYILHKTEFQLEGNECEEFFENDPIIIEQVVDIKSMLCAKQATPNRDACEVAGSPLQIIHSELKCGYQIIGITSGGSNCGNGLMDIFIRVSNYIDWIEDIVWPKRIAGLVWPY